MRHGWFGKGLSAPNVGVGCKRERSATQGPSMQRSTGWRMSPPLSASGVGPSGSQPRWLNRLDDKESKGPDADLERGANLSAHPLPVLYALDQRTGIKRCYLLRYVRSSEIPMEYAVECNIRKLTAGKFKREFESEALLEIENQLRYVSPYTLEA